VLVISGGSLNEILPVVNVIPTTSQKPGRRIYPNEAWLPSKTGDCPAYLLNPQSLLKYKASCIGQRALGVEFGSRVEQFLTDNRLSAVRRKVLSFRASEVKSDVNRTIPGPDTTGQTIVH
jgi:mRNA interferase MazF